jgi:copper chaperone CopZ
MTGQGASMEELTLAVPDMWADHHVIAVRAILTQLDGVTIEGTSALEKRVRVSYDPAQTDAQHIVAALEQGGYSTGTAGEGEAPPTDKPAWATAGVRVTTTNPDDIAMSGDHRLY